MSGSALGLGAPSSLSLGAVPPPPPRGIHLAPHSLSPLLLALEGRVLISWTTAWVESALELNRMTPVLQLRAATKYTGSHQAKGIRTTTRK